MNSKHNHTQDIDKLSLDEAFSELEEITQEFENGQVDLEAGMPLFKRGQQLAGYLKKRLSEIENEIEEVSLSDLNESPSGTETTA